jgi:cellulose synthase/poly-beta-1,6-N-acetylglucosamine synthase-like glycosyltransferase
MIFVNVVIVCIAAVLLLPTVSDLLSLVHIALSRRRVPPSPAATPPRFLFLVPAHNEEILIEPAVQSLMQLRYPASSFDVVVVADNCTDRTAELARAAGARCLERKDLTLPGKPRAIAWAIGQVRIEEYDAVVIVDADTVVPASFATALAGRAPLNGKAVQAYFDVSNQTESAITRLATVLASANHGFAYPLKQRGGLNVPLVGNGLCVGTSVLLEYGWTAFSITEDWEMYAQFTERGVKVEGAPDAIVYSQEARSLSQSWTQRQRWTAGKLTVFGRFWLPLLRSRKIGLHQKLDAVSELIAPGPVLHLGIVVLLSGGVLVAGLPVGIALLLLSSLVRTAAYSVAALRVQREPGKALAAFAYLPVYALWRVGAALASFTMLGDKPWIRTQRHASPAPESRS